MALIREGFPMYRAHFPGGDPRRFEPDEEGVQPEEMEAWQAACARADAGEVEQDGSGRIFHGNGVTVSYHVVMFGPGVYWYEEDPAEGYEVEDWSADFDFEVTPS